MKIQLRCESRNCAAEKVFVDIFAIFCYHRNNKNRDTNLDRQTKGAIIMDKNDNNPSVKEIMQNAAKYPERASEDSSERNTAEGIYAGTPPAPQPMGTVYAGPVAMMTYAGPDMMNNGIGFMTSGFGMPAMQPTPKPAPKRPDDTDSVMCEMCGYFCSKGAKFCPECGHPLGVNE